MKLSIVTINYNDAAGLRKTVESVAAQTSPDIEYIVIDGGSTDGSVAVMEEYRDKIDYQISEPDRGIYHAMNKGIVRATGDYCQFLNSGDWLVAPDTTQRMLAALDGPAIAYGNLIKHWPDGRTYRNGAAEADSLFTYYSGTLNHASAYIRRELFDKYGLYDESLKIVADWKFYLLAVGMGGETVQYIDVDVVNFDMGGISNQQTGLDKTERRQVLETTMPTNLLRDYDRYGQSLRRLRRIERYPWAVKGVYLVDRLLFGWEKHFKKRSSGA